MIYIGEVAHQANRDTHCAGAFAVNAQAKAQKTFGSY
jgi:hypothetical protein